MGNPRKKRTIIDEELPPNTNDVGADVDVADVIVMLSKVYKINAGTKSFCTQSQEPVDEIFLQNNYPAGGKYVVYEYNGMNQLVNTAHYDIEPKVIASNGNNGVNPGAMSATDMQIRMLFDELTFTRQLLMSQLTNASNKGGGINELVTALAGLHNITGGAANGKDPVELLIKGMELGANGGKVNADWKAELISGVKEIAPAALQIIASRQQPVAVADGGTTPMLPATPQETIKTQIQWIKGQVIAGMNVDLAVEWLTQNARNPEYHSLLSLAIQGTIDNFIEYDAEVANEPYRTWFTNAITQIKEWYAEQQQVQTDDDLDGGTRNDSNVSVDAKPSNRSAKQSKPV